MRTALTTFFALLSLTACTGPAPSDDKPVDSGEDTDPVGCDDKWYVDVDGDGFGDARYFVTGCEPPNGEVADATDCDDANAAAYPGAPEDCADTFDANCDGSIGFTDADRDGTAACEDCDDADPTVHPGAAEFCDGVDDDCDGEIDETPADGRFYYDDADGDGAGDLATALKACEAPDGWGTDFSDCDDTDAEVNPDALEACNGHDDDCDGSTDEREAYDALTFYDDDDGDGFGDSTTRTRACAAPVDSVDVGGDCADDDADVNPAAIEVCNDLDDDCDGTIDVAAVDPATWFADRDADGWGNAEATTQACDVPAGYVAEAGDCDDGDPTAAPDADETCDGTDDDCDGTVDEDDAVDAPTWYVDADTDGFGDRALSARACAAPAGYVAPSTDCDDADPARSPGATETCNATDDDCDGTTDEDDAADAPTWYADADADGFGAPGTARNACAVPDGYADNAEDCDDAAATVSPAVVETCNDLDDDCDGTTDEDDAADAIDWYFDADGDGWGDSAAVHRACVAPADHVAFDNDCDDGDTTYHPGADESDCDDANDYNCDGSVGRVDNDGDGFDACEECDDGTDAVFPGAFETCNLVDDDCDGTIDGEDAVGSGTWYADEDGDGYGDPAVVDHSCDLPRGFVVNADDCDDADLAVSPAGTEVCATDYDDDCDGATDDLDTPDCTDWFLDADLDGYGAGTSACACAPFDRYTAPTGDDCDDTEPLANPGGTETAGNGIDDDCDGVADAVALADADVVVAGSFAEGTTGFSLAGGADVDGDGLDDLLVGSPGDGTVADEAGAVSLVRGGASGTVLTSAADATLTGEALEDGAGYAVALGDIDGDGFAEALVGAYQNGAGGRDAGGAYLVYGPFTGTIGLADADLFLSGAAAGDAAGRGVAFPGDVDGDGIGDLLVGAPSADRAGRSSGSAFLVLGGATGSLSLSLAEAEISGNAGSDTLGSAFAPAGDTDGDGFADFWIGVENADDNGAGSGTVHLLRGPLSGAAEVGDLSDAQLLGGAVDDGAGASVANAGDIDGDGHDDVLVGAPDAGDGGAAYLVLGPFDGRAVLTDADTVFTGASGEHAGYAVTAPGDIDGDGARDLVIGGYGSTIGGGTNAGAAWLFTGVAPGSYLVSEANVTFFGASGDRAGTALAPAGDTDGDGLDELLVGAFAADPGATNGGAAYVLRGW